MTALQMMEMTTFLDKKRATHCSAAVTLLAFPSRCCRPSATSTSCCDLVHDHVA
jgi:hypothetical protein